MDVLKFKNLRMKILLQVSFLMIFMFNGYAQGFLEKKMLKKLKAKEIKMDEGNEDGVFSARSKRSKKWGMYQWMYDGVKVDELIPMKYDSIRNFPFNGAFTAVYRKGKVGFYLAKWSYEEDAKQTVACLYEDYQRFNDKGKTYLAVSKNGKWGWVDWLTGEEKTEFKYISKNELPYPNYEQKLWFED